jgi:hypothetical protein
VTEIVAPPAPGDRIGIFGRWSGSRDEPALGPYIFVGVEPNGRWLLRYYRWPDARRMSLPVECINAENPRMWATAAEIEAGPGWYTRHRDDKWMIPKQEEAEMKDDIARPPKPSPAPEPIQPAPGAPPHKPEDGIARIEHRDLPSITPAKGPDPKTAD